MMHIYIVEIPAPESFATPSNFIVNIAHIIKINQTVESFLIRYKMYCDTIFYVTYRMIAESFHFTCWQRS